MMDRTIEDLLWFTDQALDGMAAIALELGDERANQAPTLPGANSPYVILHHCLGVIGYWVGELIGGRPAHRDRDSEFHASGRVNELVDRVEKIKSQMRSDLDGADLAGELERQPGFDFAPGDHRWSGWDVMLHVLEELAQHHGHMEIERDILTSG